MKHLTLLFILTTASSTEWTIMVYLCADNSLSNQALIDLAEMETIGSGTHFDVVGQIDLPYKGAERLYVKKGGSSRYPIGEVDMCDIDVLYDFIRWAKNYYPAKKYCLILWDHGSGWTFGGPQLGFGFDQSSNNTISFVEGEMNLLLRRTKDLLGKKLDLLVFDACIMGLIEVAGEVEGYIRFMVASETTVPTGGLPYDRILDRLGEDPGISPEDLGKIIVDEYFKAYQGSFPVNLARWDLDGYTDFRKNLDKTLEAKMALPPDTSLPKRVKRPYAGHADLGSLFDDLDDIIGYVKDSGGFSGCGIWLPDSYYDFRIGIKDYLNLRWCQSRWDEFLNFTYNQDDIPPTPPVLKKCQPKGNNLLLRWHASIDLAPVQYHIYDANASEVVFSDPGDTSLWLLDGFTLTTSGYYSGNGNNLDNSMTIAEPVKVAGGLFLGFDLKYDIQDLRDTLIVEYNDHSWKRLCFYYGRSDWQRHQIIERTTGDIKIRFRYKTDGSVVRSGAYLRNIWIGDLKGLRIITNPLSDTAFYLYNQLRGKHIYLVEAIDGYGNRSDTDMTEVTFSDYAQPYSIPNPFQKSCKIIFDSPTIPVDLYIYSIDGRLIRKIEGPFPKSEVLWDGKDKKGNRVKDGIYIILVKGKGFSRLGRIAKVE